MIPVYTFVQGDTIGLLLLADEDAPIATFRALARRSASVRVADREGGVVVHQGQILADDHTLRSAGVTALDRVDIRFPEST